MRFSTIMVAAVLGLVAGDVKSFVIPAAGAIMTGTSSKSVFSSHVDTPQHRSMGGSATHYAGCSCISCLLGYSRRSVRTHEIHGKSCLCSSCAKQRSPAVLMRAHAPGCGCGECSANVLPRAFHDGPCLCPSCAPSHRAACSCAVCVGLSSLTVMGAGASADQQAELGQATTAFMKKLDEDPDSVSFKDTMATINEAFEYTPKRFINGAASNDPGVNEGSCKVFSFGKIVGLSEAETLACFGEHHRSVLEDPSGDGHVNIRAFIETGWGGISFPNGLAMTRKRG